MAAVRARIQVCRQGSKRAAPRRARRPGSPSWRAARRRPTSRRLVGKNLKRLRTKARALARGPRPRSA